MKQLTEALRMLNYFILFPAFGLAIMSPMAFDSPGSEHYLSTYLWLLLMVLYPVIVVLSIFFATKFYKLKKYDISFWISLPPLLLIALGFVLARL